MMIKIYANNFGNKGKFTKYFEEICWLGTD